MTPAQAMQDALNDQRRKDLWRIALTEIITIGERMVAKVERWQEKTP